MRRTWPSPPPGRRAPGSGTRHSGSQLPQAAPSPARSSPHLVEVAAVAHDLLAQGLHLRVDAELRLGLRSHGQQVARRGTALRTAQRPGSQTRDWRGCNYRLRARGGAASQERAQLTLPSLDAVAAHSVPLREPPLLERAASSAPIQWRPRPGRKARRPRLRRHRAGERNQASITTTSGAAISATSNPGAHSIQQ